ncbi:MAG: gamma-glutamyl-gamma-aminobutyrate hydrolase family protein [Thaumarchaeota archaeon]|nr:gamma-glutamyl-gamma-aminobutyrate hydrolase family protein [Nitrososphaerota archaeon]
MTKLLLVNNYNNSARERFMRLVSSMRRLGVGVQSSDAAQVKPEGFKNFDGIVLSGSYDMLSRSATQTKYGKEIELIREATTPVLGVCFGHQMIAIAFGARVVPSPKPVLGHYKAKILRPDPLFKGLGGSITIYESHHEVVDAVPLGFEQLATSSGSEICAMRSPKKPVYGVQFHPERSSRENPDGDRFLGNFVSAVRTGLR